jgi:hypothetical protein
MQTQQRARLRPRWDLNGDVIVESGYRQILTQHGIGDFDRLGMPQVSAAAFKSRIGSACHHDKKIAGATAGFTAWQPVTGNAQCHTILHTRWNLDRNRLLALDFAATGAIGARFIDDGPLSLAAGAHSNLPNADGTIAPARNLLTAAVAYIAATRCGTGLGAGAMTCRTCLGAGESDSFFATGGDAF